MAAKLKTFDQLFKFYQDYVKLLYSTVQADGILPTEILFELNAALDHISRHWAYGESEEEVVDKAYGHFKRCCLDVFKIKARDVGDQFAELRRLDTSIIDNGEFDGRMLALYNKIKTGAAQARRDEGRPSSGPAARDAAFELWEPVFKDCVSFEKDFYFHHSVSWAKKRMAFYRRREFWITGVTAAVIGGLLVEILRWLISVH